MLTVAVPKRNKLQNIIVLTPKDGKECRSLTIFLYIFFLFVYTNSEEI